MEIKLSKKLVSAILLMVVSLSLMVSVTFAWFTLSDNPAVSSVKITIGGDNTIMIAQDLTKTLEDGSVVHYPAVFGKTGDLSVPEGTLLSPVSTADGINWFIPTITDGQMIVEDINSFTNDTTYAFANTSEGGYAYVDFWVVSPLDNCFIRICSGDDQTGEAGSYVVQLPETVKNLKNQSGYTLDETEQTLASSVRVGFLVDDSLIEENSAMQVYSESVAFRENVSQLKGSYEVISSEKDYDFMIYEPNGLVHPNTGHSIQLGEKGIESIVCEDGEYWITKPIGIEDGNIKLINIADRLVVQERCGWLDVDGVLKIDEMYQTYLLSNPNGSLDDFYEDYMNHTYLQYVYSGYLFQDTWDLYLAGNLDVTGEDELSVLQKTNAVESSYIVRLEKNVPQRIRMFVWIEGQDVDCNYQASNQTIALRLELAGSTGA